MKLKWGFFVLFAFCAMVNVYAQARGTVGPLLQAQWAQRAPYNNMMIGTIRHRTGCGTTAMAQIMNYYRHPIRGTGRNEPYNTGLGTTVPSINFENIYFDWDNMLNIYNNSGSQLQRDAVANLMYHLAIGFRINNAPTGRDSGTSGNLIIPAMTNHFRYDRSMQRRNWRHFDDNTWLRIIREQLDAGMPVFVFNTGHFYVIDGYDNTGRFHFNWGWGGRHNGWYPPNVDWRTLGSDEDADDSGGDDNIGRYYIIINIKPDAGGVAPGYEIALEHFSAQKTTITHNEMFEVYTFMRNANPERRFLGGQAGAALVDNNGRIIEIIGTTSMGEGSFWSRLTDRPINCFIPNTVRPGQYQLRIVTKPTDGEWRLAELSLVRDGIPDTINITVNAETGTPSYLGMALTDLAASQTTASRNERFEVYTYIRNLNNSSARFLGGQAGVALVDNNNNIVAVIGTSNMGEGSFWSRLTNRPIICTIPNTVSPGRYRLMIVVRTTGGEWGIASLSVDNAPTSIDFTVR